MNSFSIIIPTLNEEGFIGYLLNDICTQPVKPKEIVVVDGNSTDNTRNIVKKFKEVKLLKTKPQLATQRNIGAKHATGQILIFLDADTRLPNEFLKKVLNKDIRVSCPIYLPYKSNFLINLVYLFFDLMFFIFQKVSASGAGSCIIVSNKLFTRLNGFNEAVKFEDIEFIRRASGKAQFSILPIYIWVSDRRFRKYGIFKTTLQYFLLSFLFLFNQFNISPFSYSFGNHSQK